MRLPKSFIEPLCIAFPARTLAIVLCTLSRVDTQPNGFSTFLHLQTYTVSWKNGSPTDRIYLRERQLGQAVKHRF